MDLEAQRAAMRERLDIVAEELASRSRVVADLDALTIQFEQSATSDAH